MKGLNEPSALTCLGRGADAFELDHVSRVLLHVQKTAINDRTHLHFFTRGSLEETVRACGWTIRALGSHMKGRYRRWYMPTRLLEPFVAVQTMLLAEKL